MSSLGATSRFSNAVSLDQTPPVGNFQRWMTSWFEWTAPAHALFEADQIGAMIDEFAELQDGWCGDDSVAPSRRVVSIAKACARSVFSVASFAEVVVLPHGTIAFDWETEYGNANLEIGENFFSFYLSVDERFFPLSGKSNGIPINDICAFVKLALVRKPVQMQTTATSYTPSIPARYSYV